jgi:hypothetical protein
MRMIIGAVIVGALVVAAVFLLIGRPTREVISTSDPDVTIRCDGSASVSEETCLEWGEEILALGAPSTTFEMEDLARLEISKPLLGFGAPCQADFFLQRFPDDATWGEDVPCKEG